MGGSMNREDAPRAPLTVVLNAAAGTHQAEATETRIRELCQEAGRDVTITASRDPEVLRRAVEAGIRSRSDAIVAGGGDGTQSSVAGMLAGGSIPLGVLPLGTLNHFARDLGIPLELDAAMQVILAGRSEAFDLGEVNGRVFLNNSSLGLYPLIVRLREQYPRRGLGKWAIAVWATLKEIRRRRELTLRIEVEGRAVVHRTPVVMVANNAYRAEGLDAGSRDSLRDGTLAIYIVKAGGRRHLLRLAWRMMRRKAPRHELEVLLAAEASIDPVLTRLPVAVDGEVEQFSAPLLYRIRPGALRVLVPPAPGP